MKRWAVIPPLLHVVLSVSWVWHHNAVYWSLLPTLQNKEDFSRTHPPSSTTKTADEVDWGMELEYHPSLEIKAIVGINPVPAILACFEVPYNATSSRRIPLLAPLIIPLASHLLLRMRAVVLNTILVGLIGLQWTLIGRRLDRILPPARFGMRIKSSALQITGLAILVEVCYRIYRATESSFTLRTVTSYSELIGSLGSVAAFLVWVSWGVIVAARFMMGLRQRALASDSQQSAGKSLRGTDDS